MSRHDDASYFEARAREEIRKASEAKQRGDKGVMIAVHAELAVRYQAKALQLQRH
ncbi:MULTISPECIES: hypothetical protein [Sphingobium]|uniref:Uncharacterized protein n=1 Tax=Sphingobium fuliginis (strain ATCC 27551) TaxID=336203 RepID=A0A292ZBE5_SPHSA|nr:MULTISPECIES: hypothetical protein [Sphingobium]MCB4860842.1 hypothetical protein [Sphingobium sp. PNB]QOT70370.1 hypothetical protein H5V43_09340 [Sphingobium fuliginis]UXC89406.1 hypothetical protein EGM87_09970 [Sphingobium sp. RSMS]WDA38293.1 hypothetical protein PO876_09020 [Sphingobium sp. YC-XJ3]GAY22032.1 hypothetical protein SFOMI_2586 [Sphingobium fuliginis]